MTSETLAQVVSSLTGDIAVLTSNNRLFYGKSGVTSLIEIAAGLTNGSRKFYVHIGSSGGVG